MKIIESTPFSVSPCGCEEMRWRGLCFAFRQLSHCRVFFWGYISCLHRLFAKKVVAQSSQCHLGLPLIIAPKPVVSSPPTQSFEKKRNLSALFAREINLVTQPSFDCEQGINSQVQTACSNADAVFPVLGIVSCRNERFSLSRKTHVPLWNEPRISHVRLL